MSLRITKAAKQDFQPVVTLYEEGVERLSRAGLSQWQWGLYPSEGILKDDLRHGRLYAAWEGEALAAAFVLNNDQDPQYDQLAWRFGQNPVVLHRVMAAPFFHPHGLGKELMDWILKEIAGLGYDCLRLDTYLLNEQAVALYESYGMRGAGQVYFDESSIPYICFEIPAAPDCCLLPIPMQPAFRHGKATPWGGSRLKELYGKAIPDGHTGESLEISAIPGAESRDPQGLPLTELIAQHGRALMGDWEGKPFPLLLKLLDAQDSLSVQVHPDDAFAAKEENGKLGKTEAWVILDAQPGAELVYGLKAGTSLSALAHAARQGTAVEPLLRRIKVRKGDVLYIPAGCVHAIGPGIVLYEIQQSSDVTYRFYDWDRRDENGGARELHIDKALRVADLDFQENPVRGLDAPGLNRLLDTPYFTLDQARVNGRLVLEPAPGVFRLLTALSNLLLAWEGDAMRLKPGSSLLLPAACPLLTLEGVGEALIAAPQGA